MEVATIDLLSLFSPAMETSCCNVSKCCREVVVIFSLEFNRKPFTDNAEGGIKKQNEIGMFILPRSNPPSSLCDQLQRPITRMEGPETGGRTSY